MFIQLRFRMSLLLCFCRVIYSDSEVITAFFKDYDKAIRPNLGEGKPATIRTNIHIESFGNIQEADMEYKVYFYLRQYWTDSRLTGKLNRTLVLKGGDIDNIWTPDLFCYNARESNLMMSNEELHSFVKINTSGAIMMSIGVTIVASCVMNLRNFPLDSQTCYLKFGSYAHSTDDLVYEWIPGEIDIGNKEMAQFEYTGAQLTSEVQIFSIGNFSTITVTFSFQRRIGYFLIQVYLPDIFVVLLSWIVFWMERDDIGNRMALGITTILTIMFLLGSLNGNLPKVSYPKALDWYLLVSFTFVFLSLIECIVVYVLMKKATKDHQRIRCKVAEIPLSKRFSASIKSLIGSKTNTGDPTSDNVKNGNTNMGGDDDLEMAYRATKADKTVVDDCVIQENVGQKRMEKITNLINDISRILFPFAFVCYNIVYWAYYRPNMGCV